MFAARESQWLPAMVQGSLHNQHRFGKSGNLFSKFSHGWRQGGYLFCFVWSKLDIVRVEGNSHEDNCTRA